MRAIAARILFAAHHFFVDNDMKRFFIDQHGCAKNQVDGELIVARLCAEGWEQTFEPAEADLIIVNSCGFIESAKTESIEAVVSARRLYPNARIMLAGCLAERYADDLSESLGEADGFFGNGDISAVADAAERTMAGLRPVSRPPQKGVCGGERNLLLSFPGAAFVKITEGCNNRCSFCAIPLIRGSLRSRPAEEIVGEIRSLVGRGVYELNLIGQDLAAYGTGADDDVFGTGRTPLPPGTPGSDGGASASSSESGLCSLLRMISAVEGEFRLRLLYVHPDHFNADILPVIKADPRILPYFDIPFQSGDDATIRAMNRTGSATGYASLVGRIREFFPEAAIRTTFLAGFPGEDDDAAARTLSFLREIRPDWSGCFPYSREEGTPAYSMKHRVPEKTAEARAAALVEAQAEITRARLSERCGREYDVLVEEVLAENADAPDEGIAIGRAWFQAPEVDGSVVVSYDRSDAAAFAAVRTGRLVRVRVTSSGDVDLYGGFVCDSPANARIRPPSLSFAQDL